MSRLELALVSWGKFSKLIRSPNGAGKSTFLKLITKKLIPTDGTITHNPEFVTAYFGQHSTKELDLEKSALEFMQWKFPKANVGILKSHLAKTSVGDSIMESRMKNLSFSQRSCVIFAALTFAIFLIYQLCSTSPAHHGRTYKFLGS